MNRWIAVFMAISLIAPTTQGKVIKNVTICAISCNSEIHEKSDIENTQAGTVYFADYNSENAKNPATCMDKAQRLPTHEFKPHEQEALAQKGCSEILHDKFFGKKVDIVTTSADSQISYVTEVIVR